MSLKYINKTYGTKYEKNMRVLINGEPGIIVGTRGAALKIHMDTAKRPGIYHPTWNIKIDSIQPEPKPKKRRSLPIAETPILHGKDAVKFLKNMKAADEGKLKVPKKDFDRALKTFLAVQAADDNCAYCGGKGYMVLPKHKCKDCKGTGKRRRD